MGARRDRHGPRLRRALVIFGFLALSLPPVACQRSPAPSADPPRAEMAGGMTPMEASREGTMTLPGADGATTRFGEAMRLEDLPEWLAVPEGVSPTGEGFIVTSAEGRRTGSIRLSMEADSDAALSAWTDAFLRAGLHVQRQDSGDAEAGFVVGTGDGGRRVHVVVTSAGDGVDCAVQYAGP